ncbi:MAG: WYL domain-containing protein [Thermomicrobiales bacterium]|nr:WYL domain-containing protein [Thermomicrobiales bacterium]
MFGADEAIGLAMALLTIPANRHSGLPAPVGQALAKIERVLPNDLRDGVAAIRSQVSLPEYADWDTLVFHNLPCWPRPAQARLRRHLWFRYGRPTGDESAREVDPYGIGNVNGRWYLHGYCHLRQDRRTFRIDRIRRVDVLPQEFEMPEDARCDQGDPGEPGDELAELDGGDRTRLSDRRSPGGDSADVCDSGRTAGWANPDAGQHLRIWVVASRALALPWEMTIISPAELRIAARTHAERRAAKSR